MSKLVPNEIKGIDFSREKHPVIFSLSEVPPVNEKNEKIFSSIETMLKDLEIPSREKILFSSILKVNINVFRAELGECNAYTHKLKMKDNIPTLNPKERRPPEGTFEKVKSYIDGFIADHVITKEGSNYISPLTVVKKNENELRICLDSRQINKLSLIHI